MKDYDTFLFHDQIVEKVLKILQLNTTSNSVFAHKFSKSKILCYIVSYIFTVGTIYYNNNSNTNETVKIHRMCHDLLNYTNRIALKKVVF